jgi:hypothetical protein
MVNGYTRCLLTSFFQKKEKDTMKNARETLGLKRLTKPHSTPVRLAKGGKELVRDNTKSRKYKVKGE